jgi:hypothetical protein
MQTEKILSYEIPENPEAMAAVQDDDRAFIFGFKTRRKVFAELGYIAVPQDDANLDACAKALCDLLYLQAVIKVMTFSPNDILERLNQTERNDSNAERNSAIVLTAARQAVSDFANKLQ